MCSSELLLFVILYYPLNLKDPSSDNVEYCEFNCFMSRCLLQILYQTPLVLETNYAQCLAENLCAENPTKKHSGTRKHHHFGSIHHIKSGHIHILLTFFFFFCLTGVIYRYPLHC